MRVDAAASLRRRPATDFPLGSKDPNNWVFGPKYYTINGIWGPKPDYLGPWTLRVFVRRVEFPSLDDKNPMAVSQAPSQWAK